RQYLERDERVVNREQAGGVGIARQLIFPNHGGNRAPAQRLLDKVVPVEAFAFNRKEEFAGLHGAGVDGISLSHRATVVLPGRNWAGRSFPGRNNEFGDAGEKKFHAVFPAVPASAALSQS